MALPNYKSDAEALDHLRDDYKKLTQEIGKVIVGQDEVIRQVIISIFGNGHSLLVGCGARVSEDFVGQHNCRSTWVEL